MTLHAVGDGWTIWSSDAVLLDTLMHDAWTLGVMRVALWRLGLEDPAIWTRLRQ
jgi:spore germination protein YaaH